MHHTFQRAATRGLMASAFAVLTGSAAVAADLAPAPKAVAPAASVATADTPVFSASFYLWASALTGTTSTLPPLPAVDVDMSFRDVLQDFDGGLMGAGEMRVGRWGFLADVLFTQVSPGGTIPGPYRADVEVRARSLTLQGNVLYRFYETDVLSVDAGAGLRFWHLDNRLSIGPGLLPSGFDYSRAASWVDPVLVGRLSAQLGGPWSVTLVGDIGGFDVGSQFTWQAIGTVNYQWNRNLALRAGYRVLSVDYQDGNFQYDVRMQGPVLGGTYRF